MFGDSLSAAYGIASARSWVALLEEKLKREQIDYSVVNASISGETSAGGRARIDAALARLAPAVVIVERAQKSRARVLLVGMRVPPNYGDEYAERFSRTFADLAKRYKTALVPFMLEGFAEKPELFQADRIHPTAEAQPLVLERIWPALAPLLK